MDKFFNSCKRCLNPKIIILLIAIIIGLIIFLPIVGIATFIAALPLLGCGLMCGGMAFMMRGDKKDNK